MEAGKRTVDDIFNGNKILEVPFFQRAYVWDEPQWERFLEDVEDVSKTHVPYFMGSLILKQKSTPADASIGNVRTVIDGQQRLTTLSILMKVLSLKSGNTKKFEKNFMIDDGVPVLQHNRNDRETYNKIISLTSLEKLTGKDKISRAYQYFADHMNESELDFNAISNCVLFVGVDLDFYEDEQQIFDTINSLGVRLTTAELLKNYFFGRDDISDYEKYWVEIFEKDDDTKEYWDQEITTGRLKRTFIDLFFYAYLLIKIQEPALNVSAEDKQSFTKVDKLFDSYKRFIKTYLADNKKAVLKEIKEYAALFRNTFDSSVINKELPAEAGIERLNAIIFALDTATLIPYILFSERNIDDQNQKDDLYAYLEAYIMRRLVSRQTTKNYNQLFAERLILNRVLSKEELAEHLAGQDDKVNRMPSDEEVKAAFHESILTNKYAAGVLYLIESKIRNRSLHATQLLGIGKYSLEHLMPKKWQNHWNFSGDKLAAEARSRTLLTLGNLTIITQALNASIRDSDWKTKKDGTDNKGGLIQYADGIETLTKYLALDKWDEVEIDKRADDLASSALKIWSLQ